MKKGENYNVKSTSIQNIAKALLTFQVKVDKVKKDAKNPFFKSSYASLTNIQESIHDALVESGLVYSQFPDGEHGLTTLVMHTDSGEFLQSTYTMKPVKDDPQGVGSCITYQKRYALAAALGLQIDEDDDGNKASGRSPVNTTSYNHKQIGTTEKPLISNEAFKKACDRIKAGELDVYEKVLDKFTLLDATQRNLFEKVYNTAKKNLQTA